MVDKMTFSKWVHARLAELGMTQKQLAIALNTSESHVSAVLKGSRSQTADFMIATAQALDADPVAVLRLAGILPRAPGDTDDPDIAEMWALVQRIPEHKRAVVMEALRAWANGA